MTDVNKPETEILHGRSPDQDLELWKHHANFGGEDKNRMVTIATWLLGGSAAILMYVLDKQIDPSQLTLIKPLVTFFVATLGIVISGVAGYVSLLYGGYANRNWGKADQIAASRKWKDLLPTDEDPSGHGLNTMAMRLAKPCKPQEELAPVFKWFFAFAVSALALHLAVFIWSLATIMKMSCR